MRLRWLVSLLLVFQLLFTSTAVGMAQGLVPSPAAASGSGNLLPLTEVAHWGGAPDRVAMLPGGGMAFVSAGKPLLVLDVNNPAQIQLLATAPLSGRVTSAIVSASLYLYLVEEGNLVIMDVSNPAEAQQVSTLTFTHAEAVDVVGDYAYVTDPVDGTLTVVDVSDPTTPNKVGTLSFGAGAALWGIDVVGNYAYIADNLQGLHIVDVSNPTQPQLKGEWIDTTSSPTEVVVSGNYAYIGDDSQGLVVVDVSNPAQPKYKTSLAYLDADGELALMGSYVVLGGYTDTLLVDISNPAQPSVTKTLAGLGAGDLAVEGSYIYATNLNQLGEFSVWDATNPGQTRLAGNYPGNGTAWDVAIWDDQQGQVMAFVADSTLGAVWAVDVSTPSQPRNTAVVYTQGTPVGLTLMPDLPGVSALLLVADVDGLAVFDPYLGQVTGRVDTNGQAVDVAIDEFLYLAGFSDVYVADGDSGLVIVNVGDPYQPQKKGSLFTGGFAGGISAQTYVDAQNTFRSIVYLADGDNGLVIVDASNPSNPQQIAHLSKITPALDVDVQGNYAYVAAGNQGLQIVDISNPYQPKVVGILAHFAASVKVRGRLAYISDGFGVALADISNPSQPRLVATEEWGWPTGRLDIWGAYLFVGQDAGGMSVLQIGNPFADVVDTHWAAKYIQRLYRAGITDGCTTTPLQYCPNAPVTRAQMAVFLLKSIHAPYRFQPPHSQPTFSDTAGHWAADWIEELKSEGITSGYPDGTYKPNRGVTRAEMAVFLLKAFHGASYTPPAVSHSRFNDVPDSHWAKDWIEQLAKEGITSGYPDGGYHPDQTITRAEMAVFLIKTFSDRIP